MRAQNMSFTNASAETVATALLAALSPKLALMASKLRIIESTDLPEEDRREIRMVVTSFRNADGDIVVLELPEEVRELRGGVAPSSKTDSREMWVSCPVCEGQGKVEEEGRALRCKECQGKKGWLDDQSNITTYFTTTGDNPAVLDQTSKLEAEVQRNFFEVAPQPTFYSAAKFDPRYSGMRPTNDEGLVVRVLLRADSIEDTRKRAEFLRTAWKRMWVRHFDHAECAQWWLTPRTMKKLVAEFKKRGVVSTTIQTQMNREVQEKVLQSRTL